MPTTRPPTPPMSAVSSLQNLKNSFARFASTAVPPLLVAAKQYMLAAKQRKDRLHAQRPPR